jgi:hypothetical protein
MSSGSSARILNKPTLNKPNARDSPWMNEYLKFYALNGDGCKYAMHTLLTGTGTHGIMKYISIKLEGPASNSDSGKLPPLVLEQESRLGLAQSPAKT